MQVIGRNLDGAWQVLAEIEDAGFTTHDQPKAWLIPVENRGKFQWLGLSILSTQGGIKKVCVHNMLMWEER